MWKELKHKVFAIVVVLVPVGVFAGLYFLLGQWPNYLFGEVDTEGVYNLELSLFGITMSDGQVLIPSEYFWQNHCAVMDVLSGILYLCWVPLPAIYALVEVFRGRPEMALRITMAFLMVNLIGFVGYYIHPASPPWYVMEHGFDVDFDTMGSAAGFVNFDQVTGIPLFTNMYCHNANVFAAIPSLHVAYNPVALYYAFKVTHNRLWQVVLATVSVGICFSAVYSGHHYIIDVVLGLLTSALGIFVFESAVMRVNAVRSAWKAVVNAIKD